MNNEKCGGKYIDFLVVKNTCIDIYIFIFDEMLMCFLMYTLLTLKTCLHKKFSFTGKSLNRRKKV